MELKLEKRSVGLKSELKKIKREGNIPAILYGKSGKVDPVIVNGREFETHLRHMKKGCLSTQIFDLSYDGNTYKAIVKDIDYHRVSYAICHLDLMLVKDDETITVKIPVVCTGEDVCVGINQGGQMKTSKRYIKTTLQVSQMPESFVIDVSKMEIGSARKVKDVELTSSMKIRDNKDLTLVSINK